MECSLGGPLSELCPMTPPTNLGIRHSRHRFNMGPYGKNILKIIFSDTAWSIWDKILVDLSLGALLSELCSMIPSANLGGHHQSTYFQHRGPIGKMFKNLL